MKKTNPLILLILIFFQSGCMSISEMSETQGSKIYIGTRTDLVMIPHLFGDEPAWGMIGIVDLPFSLIIDTVCLPYTIPHTLMKIEVNEESENI